MYTFRYSRLLTPHSPHLPLFSRSSVQFRHFLLLWPRRVHWGGGKKTSDSSVFITRPAALSTAEPRAAELFDSRRFWPLWPPTGGAVGQSFAGSSRLSLLVYQGSSSSKKKELSLKWFGENVANHKRFERGCDKRSAVCIPFVFLCGGFSWTMFQSGRRSLLCKRQPTGRVSVQSFRLWLAYETQCYLFGYLKGWSAAASNYLLHSKALLYFPYNKE